MKLNNYNKCRLLALDIYSYFISDYYHYRERGNFSKDDENIELIDVNKYRHEDDEKEILIVNTTDKYGENGFEIHIHPYNSENIIEIKYIINIMLNSKSSKQRIKGYKNYFYKVKSIVDEKLKEYDINKDIISDKYIYREYKNLKIVNEIEEENVDVMVKKLKMENKLNKDDD